MNQQITMAPVRKSITVAATPHRAFEVFTAGIDRWWPKSHKISQAEVVRILIEPRPGGRWYNECDDGSEVTIGHVLAWEPPGRFVVSWEIDAAWRSDPRRDRTSEVEVRFTALEDGGTRVDIEHRHFERMGAEPGETMRRGVDGGWPGLLQLFAAAVATP